MISDYSPSLQIAEYFSLYYKPVKVEVLDGNTSVDPLYGEAKDRVYALLPSYVPLYFRFDADEKTLTRFGIDRKEDLFIAISPALAQDAGWVPKVGDRIEVNGELFEITLLKPQHAFDGNVYLLVGSAKRWQSG